MPIALFPFYALDIFHMKVGEIDYRIMVLCIFLPFWLFYAAPIVFVALGLAKWRKGEEDDEPCEIGKVEVEKKKTK